MVNVSVVGVQDRVVVRVNSGLHVLVLIEDVEIFV